MHRKGVIIFGFVGHMLIGVAVGLSITRSPVNFMTIVIGSLLPDIDHPSSIIGHYNPLVRFMKHRGHMHSLLGILILSLPFGLLGAYYYAVIGALTHLFGDKILSWFPKHKKFKLKIW